MKKCIRARTYLLTNCGNEQQFSKKCTIWPRLHAIIMLEFFFQLINYVYVIFITLSPISVSSSNKDVRTLQIQIKLGST